MRGSRDWLRGATRENLREGEETLLLLLFHDTGFRASKRAGKGLGAQLLKALGSAGLHIRPLAGERAGENVIMQNVREALA